MAGAGTPGREGTPMLTVVPDVAGALPADGQPSSLIDQIVRDGARQMLAAALQAEVAAYIDQFAGLRDEGGRRLVVRNGAAEPRPVLTSAGAHVGVRVGEVKLGLVGMIGVRAAGRRELVALADGYRESTESWADLLRDCARRGMRAPVLAIGDGALGFWTAVRDVFPQARTQRCWFHKIANVLGALPRSAHPGAKKALAEIWNAEDKDHARAAVKAFAPAYGAKFPKAAAKITDDEDELLAFYDYPAEHWIHLPTPNPLESPFPTLPLPPPVSQAPAPKTASR